MSVTKDRVEEIRNGLTLSDRVKKEMGLMPEADDNTSSMIRDLLSAYDAEVEKNAPAQAQINALKAENEALREAAQKVVDGKSMHDAPNYGRVWYEVDFNDLNALSAQLGRKEDDSAEKG